MSEARLNELAVESGWSQASDAERGHISRCAACISALLFKMDADAPEQSSVVPFPKRTPSRMSYGLLEAASTGGIRSPVTSTSAGGQFVLRILPEQDEPRRGLVTIEYKGEDPTTDGTLCTVKDSAGNTLLQAQLRGGRAAAHAENLVEIDLSQGWTLTVLDHPDEE